MDNIDFGTETLPKPKPLLFVIIFWRLNFMSCLDAVPDFHVIQSSDSGCEASNGINSGPIQRDFKELQGEECSSLGHGFAFQVYYYIVENPPGLSFSPSTPRLARLPPRLSLTGRPEVHTPLTLKPGTGDFLVITPKFATD